MSAFPSILEGIKDLELGHIKALLRRTNDLKSGQPPRLPLQKTLAVATSFLENSTRTKLSFAMAIMRIGGYHIDFHAESSSLKKGESLEQTLLTLKYQGVDICIIRTNESHLLDQFREYPPIKIINGGDGINQHPTQALLDLYTLQDHFGGLKNIKGKTISIVGDCIHSRVTHSLTDLLPQFGVNVLLCGPDFFIPEEMPAGVNRVTSLDEAIEQSDAIYLLRVQTERHDKSISDKLKNYQQEWGLTFDRFRKHSKVLPVFHPGPANIGIEVEQDIVNSEIWMAHKQVQNSVFVRMAIIEAMINNEDHHIGSQYKKIPGDISERIRNT